MDNKFLDLIYNVKLLSLGVIRNLLYIYYIFYFFWKTCHLTQVSEYYEQIQWYHSVMEYIEKPICYILL